jgi:O-antigen ligase
MIAGIPGRRLVGHIDQRFLAGALLAAYAAAIAIARGPALWALAAPLVLIPAAIWLLRSANAWMGLFFAVALLAPPLPVAFGNSGPHPAIAIAAIGIAIGLIRLREWRFERTPVAGAIVLFFAALTISIAPAAIYSGTDLALQSLARIVLAGISAYVFFYVTAGPERFFKEKPASVPLALIYWIAVASAAFAILDFYFQFPAPAGFGPQFIWLDTGVYRRAQGLFYEASTLGNFCAFFLVMVAVALVKRMSLAKQGSTGAASRIALLAGGAILMTALILSYSRSCLVNLGVALAALAILERRRIKWARVGVVAAITAAVVLGVLVRFFPAYGELYWTRLSASVNLALESNARVFSGRIESWGMLLQFLIDHPWHALLGVGYKTLPYSSFIGHPVVADNMYLSILVETGVVGLAALIALNFAILRAGYRAARSGDGERSFYGAWIFCFWAAQTVQMLSADLLTFWRVLPVYFWALGMAVGAPDGNRR